MKKFIIAALALTPSFAFAQDLGNIEQLVGSIGDIVAMALPIVVALALLAFFWGLVKYIFAVADDDKAAGKKLMIWGIIAFFVMVSVWGLVEWVGEALGVEQQNSIDVPTVEGL